MVFFISKGGAYFRVQYRIVFERISGSWKGNTATIPEKGIPWDYSKMFGSSLIDFIEKRGCIS
jgi:hypothetical protein